MNDVERDFIVKERIEAIRTKITEATKGLSAKTKKIILIGIAASLLASIGIAVWLNNRPYEMLFSDLTNEEASEIMGKLQEQGVDYKYETTGTILVPENQAEQLKAQLVYEGYPKSGFTYDYYLSNIDLTTSESEKEQYKLMDLQESLRSTIALFPNVKDVNVLVSLAKDKKYVLDTEEEKKASASVTVTTENKEPLEEETVKAIQRLVSKSTPDMEFSNVVVICNGKDVSITEERSQVDSNELKFQIEQAIDEKIREKVMTVLLPIYGEEHVEVSVHSEVDINKKLREMINYSAEDPQTNTGVISAQNATQEVSKDRENQGGVPGAETNADIPIYTRINTDGTESYILSDGSVQYLVDQIKEQEQIDTNTLKDLTIAVIIDGRNTGGISRANLSSLVAKAAGIAPDQQNDKIEIVTAPFYSDKTEPITDDKPKMTQDEIRQILLWVIVAGVALLFLLLILLILLKRRRKRRERFEQSMQQQALQAANRIPNAAIPTAMSQESMDQVNNLDMVADLLDIKNERSMELKNKIREMTEESPEISAQTLKMWLRGGKQ